MQMIDCIYRNVINACSSLRLAMQKMLIKELRRSISERLSVIHKTRFAIGVNQAVSGGGK